MDTYNIFSNLKDLLYEETGGLIGIEMELQRHLKKWEMTEYSPSVQFLLRYYLDSVEGHIENLTTFSNIERIPSVQFSSNIIKVLAEEIDDDLDNCSCREVKEACLITGIQGINHYKISLYGTVACFANAMELKHVAGIFHEAVEDEKNIDKKFSHIAQHIININAKKTC